MRPSGFRDRVVLTGRYVELVPLSRGHVAGLARAGADESVWEFLRIGPGRTEEEMGRLVDVLLDLEARGEVMPFAVHALPEHRPVGMFRFLDIDRDDRRVEVGTWLDPLVWRTPVNTEVKYLGLRHAFEVEGVRRVQLKTDSRNARSQVAIERLGATREGTLREHIRRRDHSFRSSVVYSVLANEWPGVRSALEGQLARPWPPGPGGAPSA